MNLIEKYTKDFEKLSEKNVIVGLTGTIGSGKTTVLNLFKKYGAFTISCDSIVSELLTTEKICDKILSRFPVASVSGELDKKKLSEIVFNDKKNKKWLENLLHPLVVEEIIKRTGKLKNKLIVIEIPLLFETGFDKLVDVVLNVTSQEKLRYSRLKKRGLSLKEIKIREKNQISEKEKINRSMINVINNDDLKALENKVSYVFNLLIKFLKYKKIRSSYGKK